METNRALITGASSGIGVEFARIHARAGGDLVIVARREEALNALKRELESQFGVSVDVIPADLSQTDATANLFSRTQELGLEIDVLINNAGFGSHGKFHQQDLTKHQSMMQVNMVALTELTYLYLQSMVERNRGKILNVASTAAFMPGPLQAVYYASKSYVLSFTQAIGQELKGTNITATALCPGAVATEFVAAGDLEGVEIFDNAATPESVAGCGYQAMLKGDLVKINEARLSFMLNWIVPLMPRKMVLNVSENAMQKST